MLSLILLFPLLGFLINGLWYFFFQSSEKSRKASAAITGGIATIAIGSSFVVALLCFLRLKGLPEDARLLEETVFTWISTPTLKLGFVLRLDVLSSLFALVISGIGTLIHLYSVGYMSHDATPGKFFSYLNLFCFAMLILVLGGSLPVMFLGWEGVGLCSYLLIGYWYTDIEKASAGKKAFIVNRVGDLGFILGMFFIYSNFGTLDFVELKANVLQAQAAGALPVAAIITAMCLLLFVGCMGKSAQIPLYVWLPDAMAGPTPVSALIHAATMVTSGVYLLARVNFIYVLSPTAMSTVAVVGVLTAFLAATIAVAQSDIKKILAYSTVSQLGFMFVACGVGSFSAGVFHVITHAFFKALLFLGAGSVIHGMHEEQNIFKMGGLRSHMKITFLTFLVAWLAISGIPPFSGFFSKDEILWHAFALENGNKFVWMLGMATAVMTAFYMTRLFVLTFYGKERFELNSAHSPSHHDSHGHDSHGHSANKGGVHESPWMMTVPLLVLAILSAVGGFIGIPHLSWIGHWLDPVVPHVSQIASDISPTMEWVLMGVSVLGALVGIVAAILFYKTQGKQKTDLLEPVLGKLYRVLENKWYVDELYQAVFVEPIRKFSIGLWNWIDVRVIDKAVLGSGRLSIWSGQMLRSVQTGSLQVYAIIMIVGALLITTYVMMAG